MGKPTAYLNDRPADLTLALVFFSTRVQGVLTMVNGIHRDGLNFFKTKLDGTSNATYDTKKTGPISRVCMPHSLIEALLYSREVSFNWVLRPDISVGVVLVGIDS